MVLEKKEEELKEHSKLSILLDSKFRNEKEGQRRAITPSVLAPSMSFRGFGSGAFDMGLDQLSSIVSTYAFPTVPSGLDTFIILQTGPTLGLL